MTVAQAVLGVALIVVGTALIAGRRRIAIRARTGGNWIVGTDVVWLFLGALLTINGVLQLVLAFA